MNGKTRRWPGKFIIGLTGNIAAGKSSVSALLDEQPLVRALDADLVAREVLQPSGECYDTVLDVFGRDILLDNGSARPPIDRRRLGSIVFNDEDRLRQLEALTHPAIRRILTDRISACAEPIIVLEAIKLLESSLRDELDTIWVVDASEEVRRQRLQSARRLSAEEARQRIAAQAPQRDKLAQADLIIQNDGSWEETTTQVTAALAPILERYAKRGRIQSVALAR